MTVEELIEKLLTLDPKAKVKCLDHIGEIDIWTDDWKEEYITTIVLPTV